MIKRHFPVPTSRSLFSPEHAFPPPPFAFRTTFPLEGLPLPDTSCNGPSTPEALKLGPPYGTSQGRSVLIPKPKGEGNRADTYNLKSFCEGQLGWSVTHFEEIQLLIDTNLDKEVSRTQQAMEMKRLGYDEATRRVPTLKQGDSLHGAVDENWLINDFIALRLRHPDHQRRKANDSGMSANATSAAK